MTDIFRNFRGWALTLLAGVLVGCSLLPGGVAAPAAIPVATSAPVAVATKANAVVAPTSAAIAARATATPVAATAVVETVPVADTFGLLGDVIQKVFVKPDPNADEHPGVFGEALPKGGQLRTDETGRARLLLENGTTVRMAPNTQMVLLDQQQPENQDLLTRLSLLTGKVWVILGRGVDETLKIETPIGVGAVRGSYISVEYIPGLPDDFSDDILIITCLEGDCALETATGTVTLTTGQKIEIQGNGNVVGPVTMTQNDIEVWLDNNVEILILFGVLDQSQGGQLPQSFGPFIINGDGTITIISTPTPTLTPTPTATPGGGATLPVAPAPAASVNWPNTFNGRADGAMVMLTGLMLGVVGARRIKRKK